MFTEKNNIKPTRRNKKAEIKRKETQELIESLQDGILIPSMEASEIMNHMDKGSKIKSKDMILKSSLQSLFLVKHKEEFTVNGKATLSSDDIIKVEFNKAQKDVEDLMKNNENFGKEDEEKFSNKIKELENEIKEHERVLDDFFADEQTQSFWEVKGIDRKIKY